MKGKILFFLFGTILGCVAMLLLPDREQPKFSYSLKQSIVISDGSKDFPIPSGIRLFSDGKLTMSHEVGNMLYIPVAFSPEETASLISNEVKVKKSNSYFIKGEKTKP